MARQRGKLVGQQRVVKVKLTSIIGSKAFQLGFNTAARSEGWPAEYEKMNARDQWRFERGRFVGTVAPTITLKVGRSITQDAVNAYRAVA